MASSSNPSPLHFTHDVFVSYMHEDTGNSFTSHLKSAFDREGFNVAMNDTVEKGEEMSDTLLSKISESLVYVVVFSKSYASCAQCLDELVKIWESKEENERRLLPVFLGVEPTHVRNQTGAFGDGFQRLIESKQFKEKEETWKYALTKTANLSGWDSMVKSEAEILEDVVKCINKTLEQLPSRNYNDGFVGIYQVEAVESLLQLQSKTDVQFLGIWGMGGIGKTKISKELCDRISSLFDGTCYLENVQTLEKKGLQSLSEEIFSRLLKDFKPSLPHSAKRALKNKRVLIILDDVSDSPKLMSLVKNDLSYGPGSRIILTCRDKQVLKNYQCEVYEVQKLDSCESFKLFKFHAFKGQLCHELHEALLNKVLLYCGGLPLALELLGCNLYDKNFEEWESELVKLENIPNHNVNDVMRISYEGLDENEKSIFLDIACVFCGWDETVVKRILNACKRYPVSGIRCLIDKALITNSDGILRMHDLIQQFGQDMVISECKEEPGNRSRLWRFEDFSLIVARNMGSEKVEVISVDLSKERTNMYMISPKKIDVCIKRNFFDKMHQLRVLNLHDSHCRDIIHLPKGLRSLPNKLSYLRWDYYPLTSFPKKFPNHLVELRLTGSRLKQLWSKEAEPLLPLLECVNLSFSKALINLPDLSKCPNLKTLDVRCCVTLVEIPSSILHLSKLQTLNVDRCINLTKLPVLPQGLKVLRADGCTSLRIEGDIFGLSLIEIHLCRTSVESLPTSIKHLSQLRELHLRECKNLKSLPDLSSSLKVLNADGCTSLRIEGDIFGLSLIQIHLYKTGVESLPASIKHLSQLVELHLRECKNLKSLPDLPSSLMILHADGCTSLKIEGDIFGLSLIEIHLCRTGVESLPASIKHLSRLEKLHLRESKNLKSLPGLPSSLMILDADGCTSLRIEGDIFGLSLIEIHLCRTSVESLPASIKQLSQLREFYLKECKNLKSLPDLPSSLMILHADGCTSLRIEGDIFSLSLIEIHLCRTGIESLPASIKHLSQLRELYLEECKKLKFLPDLPSSLDALNASGCTLLTTVGNIFGEYNGRRSFKFNLNMGGCFNLDQNSRIICLDIAQAKINASERLFSHLGANDWALLPGSEVPDWFKYKAEGSSIERELLGGMLLEHLEELAFCILIDDCSNIMEISSGSLSLHARCEGMFFTEFGECCFYSFCGFGDDFHDIDGTSMHVILWAASVEETCTFNQKIQESRSPRMMCSKARFEFEAHIQYRDICGSSMFSECKIMHCGVSPLRNRETCMGEGCQSQYKEEAESQSESDEEEEPSPKRLKCDNQALTPCLELDLKL